MTQAYVCEVMTHRAWLAWVGWVSAGGINESDLISTFDRYIAQGKRGSVAFTYTLWDFGLF